MTAQYMNNAYSVCRFGFQSLISTMLIGVSSLLLVSGAEAASLKAASSVNDDVIRLADLFDDVEHGDIVLGAAPKPGESMTLNANLLKRIAMNNAVEWMPKSPYEQIVVKRESHIIDETMMNDALKASLVEKGVDGNFTLTLSNAASGIVLPGNVEKTVEVSGINYMDGRDVFTATLAAPSAANPIKTATISGIINRTVQVPSLNTTTRQGDIISASDIAWIEVPVRSVGKDTIIDADELIGKTPLRVIAADKPVRFKDVMAPKLVTRGDDVTILYKVGGMVLSAKGKSQQNGSQGDLIRVTNLSSAKAMSAEVTGDRVVTIQ